MYFCIQVNVVLLVCITLCSQCLNWLKLLASFEHGKMHGNHRAHVMLQPGIICYSLSLFEKPTLS